MDGEPHFFHNQLIPLWILQRYKSRQMAVLKYFCKVVTVPAGSWCRNVWR